MTTDQWLTAIMLGYSVGAIFGFVAAAAINGGK